MDERKILLAQQRAQSVVRAELEFPPNWSLDQMAKLQERRKVETLRHRENTPTNAPDRVVRDRRGQFLVCPPDPLPTVTSQWTLRYDPSVPVYWKL